MIAKNKICRSLLVFSLGICLFAASDNTPYSVAVDLHNPKVEKNYIEKRRKYVESKINIPKQIKCADKLFTDAKAVPVVIQNQDKSNTKVIQDQEESNTKTSEPEYTFTEMSGEKYVTTQANVRDNPSTDGSVITVLNYGDTVEIVSLCNETGWYGIKINNDTGYISDKLLSDDPMVKETETTEPVEEVQTEPAEEPQPEFQSESQPESQPVDNVAQETTDTKEEKNNTYCNEYYNDNIFVQDETDENIVYLLDSMTKLLPDKYWNDFKSYGWKIILCSNISANDSYKIVGKTAYTRRTIFLVNEDWNVKESFYHEFGHFIDCQYGYDGVRLSEHDEFETLYAAEKNTFNSLCESVTGYAISDEHEFFAAAYNEYLLHPDNLASCCPNVYEYMKNLP